MSENLPVLAMTPGEPAGIGPDLALDIAQQSLDARIVVIADPALIRARADQIPAARDLPEWPQWKEQQQAGTYLLPIKLDYPVVAGQLAKENADYVLKTLDTAIDGCIAGKFDAMVTGPVNKAVINEAGHAFTGHTEYLANRAGVEKVVMMLTAGDLRVALATTHLPLAEVPAAINQPLLEQVLTIIDHDLRCYFGIAQPRIAVCGLNPHAGEAGHLGREEIEIISPAIEVMRTKGLNLLGPLPADTAFTPEALAQCDVVLAMYHDQGLPVLKHAGFGKAVNITLGLPFIRTSVDHGTALELAGTGKANSDSLQQALLTALSMTRQ
jgi:4-hydroxythreonine-4-phosphate dehydrogenase